MILICGANGKLGRLVIQQLLKRVPASKIIAGVRSPEKAQAYVEQGIEVRKVDYNQPATLAAALQGVERVLLISSNAVGQRAEQHHAVITASVQAKVSLIAYTSVLHADTSKILLATEHQATEALLQASGLPFVFLRNGWYIENYSENLASALQHGVMLGSAGLGRVAPAARNDFAEAAAVVLTTEGQAGKIYELAGDQAYTLAELAAIVSNVSGKTVQYQDLPAENYAAFLESVGVPRGFADILADSDLGIVRGDLNDHSGDLRNLIGRPTTPVAEVFAAAVA